MSEQQVEERVWIILAFEVEQSDVGPAYTSEEAAEAHVERNGGSVVEVELKPASSELEEAIETARDSRNSNEFVGNVFRAALAKDRQ